MTSRRRFLKSSALAASSMMAARARPHAMPQAVAPAVPNLDPNRLAKFVDPLPLPAIAKPDGMTEVPGGGERVPLYRVSMRAAAAKLHRDLPPTPLWTFGGACPGVTFETVSGRALAVEWSNQLPASHFLPVDRSLHGAAAGVPDGRGVVHLHGGRTPPESDGYPDDWFAPGQSHRYFYPNQQDAALLWYHDHSMGINRLNMYAGLFGLHVVRDRVEESLRLPSGRHEIPLVLADRNLKPDGSLSYPVSADPAHPWVPEAFGEIHLVNGKIFPYLDVEPRKYRVRILNAANGRFYRLSISPQTPLHQIGCDQGLLRSPVTTPYVQLAPAERADLIVDFAPHRGEQLTLMSDSFTLMQFRVSGAKVSDASVLPSQLRPLPRLAENAAVLTRRLTLDEQTNMVAESEGMLLNKTPWHMPITERPVLGTTEIWELVNLTDDVHPIHLHLVKFQILDRRRFDGFDYMTAGKLRYTGAVILPEANESGWKDTVRVNAKTVTRIIVPFEGYAGRYVWHCHLLEHEDNEMMRPYEILPAKT